MATRRKKTTKVKDLPPVVDMVTIKGACIGVQLEKRGPSDPHILFRMLVEDDENWFPQDFCVSSSWIDETIQVLKTARDMMRNTATPDLADNGRQYGYRFKA